MCVCDEWRINQTRCVYNPNSGLTVMRCSSSSIHADAFRPRRREHIIPTWNAEESREMHYADYHHCYDAAGPLYVRIEIRMSVCVLCKSSLFRIRALPKWVKKSRMQLSLLILSTFVNAALCFSHSRCEIAD